MNKNIAKLENLLGYKFNNISFLERAITHRSWAYEKVLTGQESEVRELHNETYEFLGDSILGMAVAEYLFEKHPKASEGDLTLMKHHLVSTETLAKTSQKINLGDFLKVGKGEEKTGGRRKQTLLADAFEAIIAAIFFDGGYVCARAFINRMLIEELKKTTPVSALDYKTLFQETLQAEKKPAPVYKVSKFEGPPHQRVFFVVVKWDKGEAQGSGTSIKSAEMQAAKNALETLKKKST